MAVLNCEYCRAGNRTRTCGEKLIWQFTKLLQSPLCDSGNIIIEPSTRIELMSVVYETTIIIHYTMMAINWAGTRIRTENLPITGRTHHAIVLCRQRPRCQRTLQTFSAEILLYRWRESNSHEIISLTGFLDQRGYRYTTPAYYNYRCSYFNLNNTPRIERVPQVSWCALHQHPVLFRSPYGIWTHALHSESVTT